MYFSNPNYSYSFDVLGCPVELGEISRGIEKYIPYVLLLFLVAFSLLVVGNCWCLCNASSVVLCGNIAVVLCQVNGIEEYTPRFLCSCSCLSTACSVVLCGNIAVVLWRVKGLEEYIPCFLRFERCDGGGVPLLLLVNR